VKSLHIPVQQETYKSGVQQKQMTKSSSQKSTTKADSKEDAHLQSGDND
jgi:hypothetical protein